MCHQHHSLKDALQQLKVEEVHIAKQVSVKDLVLRHFHKFRKEIINIEEEVNTLEQVLVEGVKTGRGNFHSHWSTYETSDKMQDLHEDKEINLKTIQAKITGVLCQAKRLMKHLQEKEERSSYLEKENFTLRETMTSIQSQNQKHLSLGETTEGLQPNNHKPDEWNGESSWEQIDCETSDSSRSASGRSRCSSKNNCKRSTGRLLPCLPINIGEGSTLSVDTDGNALAPGMTETVRSPEGSTISCLARDGTIIRASRLKGDGVYMTRDQIHRLRMSLSCMDRGVARQS